MASSLTLKKLKSIIKKAYEAGYHGCLELSDSYVDSEVEEIYKESCKEEESVFRIWRVNELACLPEGTEFDHSRLGKGIIRGEGIKKRMCFDSLLPESTPPTRLEEYFINNGPPWDEKMRKI